MSVRLYMDENVQQSITDELIRQQVDVLRAQEDIPLGTPDPEVLSRASELGRVLFSRDDDLLKEANRRLENGEEFLGVIYAHQMRATIGQCVNDLKLIAEATNMEEWVNRVEYLPLK